MTNRVPPTPEDQQIFKHNFERMLRWTQHLPAMEAMRALNRWCGDYQHMKGGNLPCT